MAVLVEVVAAAAADVRSWEHTEYATPRKYLGPARDELIRMVRYKNEQVLMSAGKA